MTAELFISVDIEADGDIPGPYSMSSLGAYVPGLRTSKGELRDYGDRRFYSNPPDFTWRTHYVELRPISDQFIPEAAKVSGLNRDELIRNGADPAEAMTAFADWIDATATRISREIGEKARPVFLAYPLGYDWMWTYWYLMRFAGRSPFGHSTHLDMKSDYAARAGASILRSTKRQMPRHLLGTGPHTHNALDDAIEQGQMGMKLLAWNGRR